MLASTRKKVPTDMSTNDSTPTPQNAPHNGTNSPDVIVVGAGLAGLVSAISLLQRGYSVTILERRSVAGGLCGSTNINGYTFTLACNDFGSSMRQYLADLGMSLPFDEHASMWHIGGEKYVLPPTPDTAKLLADHKPDSDRMANEISKPGLEDRYESAADLVAATIHDPGFADFQTLPSYVSGLDPAAHRLDWFLQGSSKNPDYGYGTLITPPEGPQQITDALVARVSDLGGQLHYDTDVHQIRQGSHGKVVTTSHGVFQARSVVSSQGRFSSDTPRSGLELATLHLATRPNVPFPSGIHTVGSLPVGLRHWLSLLDAGQLPEEFGFHIFPCATTEKYRSFNVYFYYPRDVAELGETECQAAQEYIVGELDRMMPGFASMIEFQRVVSPAQLKDEQGLRRVSIQDILPRGVDKPGIYDAETDIYHVGNAVGPPAYHACAAVLSGLQAAELLASHNESSQPV